MLKTVDNYNKTLNKNWLINKQKKNYTKNAIMIHNDTTNQIVATECF